MISSYTAAYLRSSIVMKLRHLLITVVQEHGIDVSGKVPRLLTPELAETASLLITMGCGEACPFVPGLERLDWPLTDPKGKTQDEVKLFFSGLLLIFKLV